MATELRIAGAALALLGASACIPEIKQTKVENVLDAMPEHFATETSTAATVASDAPWQDLFADPKLSELVEVALSNNQELQILAQEITARGAEVGEKNGEMFPRVDARAGVGIEKVGKYTSQGVSDEAHEVPEHLGSFTVGLYASWELDIWGKLRNATKAAVLRYLSTIEGRSFAVTRLVSEVASSYYELMALDNELKVLDRNIELQQNALETARLLKASARATELAVQRFEAEVLKNQSRRFEIQQEIIETENHLGFLLGGFPRKIERDSEHFLASSPAVVKAGLPSDLLRNRPDVRQAELGLQASELNVDVARAAFYPSLSIEAGIGYDAYKPERIFSTPESILYGLAGNIVAPLFNRNAITANYLVANADKVRAVYDYQRTVLKAYAEAANGLSRVENLARAFELEEKRVERLDASTKTSSTLFKSARADYLEVLTARQELLESQLELNELKKGQLKATVSIYQALGGGWRSYVGPEERQWTDWDDRSEERR